jgi:hypothetical protein
MNKIILLLILPCVLSCQGKKVYPDLINDVSQYSGSDFSKEHMDFLVYKEATTKNNSVPISKKMNDNYYPWSYSVSENRANEILTQIEKSIIAITDGASDYNKEPSSTIILSSFVDNFSKQQLLEYRKNGYITNQKSILDYVEAKVTKYELINEKNEKVILSTDFLGLKGGGMEEKNGKLLDGLGFETMGMGNFKYLSLKGFIEIEIKIPTEYEKQEITKNSIGTELTIAGQTVEILELDANVLHFKLLDSDSVKFSYYIDNCNQSSGMVYIPESIYTKFRKNQGLNYDAFKKKRKEFGLENIQYKDEKNIVYILRSDDCQLEEVFFYCLGNSNLIKKTIRVPVNIKIK